MRKFLSAMCFIAAGAVAVLALIYYWPKITDYADNLIEYHEIRQKYTEDPPKYEEGEEDELARYLRSMGLNPDEYGPIRVDSESLLAENEDYIGWIYVPKTAISYPVVRADDNDEYLHADFYKQYNFAGTIFLDAYCWNGLDNHHTILYGHNMRVGTMFAGLNRFREQDYADDHPIFWFITPEEFKLYVIVSVVTPNPYDRMQYGVDGFDFQTDEEYEEALAQMIGSSVIEPTYEREVTAEDYIMSLSTCTGDSSVRCMAHGRFERGFDIESNQNSYAKDDDGDGAIDERLLESLVRRFSATEAHGESHGGGTSLGIGASIGASYGWSETWPDSDGAAEVRSENYDGFRLGLMRTEVLGAPGY